MVELVSLGKPFRGCSAPAGAPGVRRLDTAFPDQGADDLARLEGSRRSPKRPVRPPNSAVSSTHENLDRSRVIVAKSNSEGLEA